MVEHDRFVIGIHDAFLVHAQRIKQRGHRQFATAVDARKYQILGVEFEIQPRPAIGNDPASEQKLARRMGLALVMVKEHARRAVHLADDHPFGTVHNEGAVGRHQRHVAHIDVLFLDVFDRARARRFVDIKYDQAQRHLQGRCIGQVALHTFVNVVLGLFQLVLDELQHSRFVKIPDRENRLERALDTFVIQRLVAFARAQEQIVGAFLHLDQVRHL